MTNQNGFAGWENRPEDGQEIEVRMPFGEICTGTYWSDDGIDGVFEIADPGDNLVDVMEVEEYASTTMWRAVAST